MKHFLLWERHRSTPLTQISSWLKCKKKRRWRRRRKKGNTRLQSSFKVYIPPSKPSLMKPYEWPARVIFFHSSQNKSFPLSLTPNPGVKHIMAKHTDISDSLACTLSQAGFQDWRKEKKQVNMDKIEAHLVPPGFRLRSRTVQERRKVAEKPIYSYLQLVVVEKLYSGLLSLHN